MENYSGNIEDLAKVTTALFPKLDKDEKRIALQLYRLLAEGNGVSSEMLANTVDLPIETIDRTIAKWPGVYFDHERRVVGFWGLALPVMDHYFEIDGRELYTWCAWDTLFIPQLLGKAAKVESSCPVTGEKVSLTVTPDKFFDLSPAETVISFITPEATKIQEDVVNHFCHYVHFFGSADSGHQWISDNKGTFLLSMEDAFRLGQLKNQIRFEPVFQSTL